MTPPSDWSTFWANYNLCHIARTAHADRCLHTYNTQPRNRHHRISTPDQWLDRGVEQ
ncbi:hypothetical protein SERLA73DRAFT_184599 [Serpula lacrymans var. lacrymans S7.3]|uniref:Uncharacterized protein n=2 Tax=Serpula lacrymans var. lacrymans TaxID=341189 RepID=F8Q4P5_SERL3|nr:uncharacterized protein SERLADRAFT_472368 [Serpula lacrymans var. lacrymans S7.9]EGN96522.1 hypothetical protein SERLA73DRAFT_184599 [Serpula lacrymans var. lacrymans S7.3]EGO22067.1 hypothetical protein SERLADRAFT_472368 [Serpula lacrymans var. lacrymans S7.9]